MSSRRVVTLFAGQGAQEVGMGRDLAQAFPAAEEMFARADEILGFALSAVMFEGPEEELTRTSRCQPALYVHGLACLEILKEKVPGLEIAAAAGLSLGEFTAHAAAGTFDFETGLNLVFKRGTFMEEDARNAGGTMAAMVGGTEEDVRRLAAQTGVDVANFNAPGQIVLSGTREGIAEAMARAKEFGIKIAKELDVAGAYHSKLMRHAQAKLAGVLAETEFREPAVPVICNVEARPVAGADDIRATLEAQVTGSVRWCESMRHLVDAGHRFFVELGPGGVLAGLMRRIERGATVLKIGDVGSLEAAAGELRNEQAGTAPQGSGKSV
jgi:[acyl-carrier-protein] S-malonyltransferase